MVIRASLAISGKFEICDPVKGLRELVRSKFELVTAGASEFGDFGSNTLSTVDSWCVPPTSVFAAFLSGQGAKSAVFLVPF